MEENKNQCYTKLVGDKMYTICYVEDELDLANLIKTYLEKEQYNVVCF